MTVLEEHSGRIRRHEWAPRGWWTRRIVVGGPLAIRQMLRDSLGFIPFLERGTVTMCIRSTIAVSVAGLVLARMPVGQKPQYPDYPSETPEHFQAPTAGMDYARREVMIPMRDGVKLHTVILLPKGVPKGAKGAGILMTRTPYNASALTMNSPSQHLGTALWGYDNAVETI